MITPSRRTFTNAAVLLGVGLFALGAASRIPPLRALERWIVKQVALAIDPVDTILDGDGSQSKPWTRRKAVPPVVAPPPRLLNIGDEPDGWFSASPLSPVDHALIFSKLHNAGHKILGVGHLMAWDEAEPLAMDGLRMKLDLFDAAVLALPLARGAGGEPVPAPFLRWSMPEDDAEGDVSSFPRVNRVSIPNAELGGEKSLAGFSLLENESDPGDGKQPLLARWNDLIVFSFPLAVEIAARGLTPSDVMIRAGKDIRLGTDGPVIPIDDFGRGPVATDVMALDVPAMRLISEENPLPPTAEPLLTRDVRAALAPEEKAWSDRLAASAQALRLAQRFQPSVTLPRPDAMLELLLISGLTLFGTWATRMRHIAWRIIAAVMIAGLSVELLYLLAARHNEWLPPLALLCPGIAALGLSFLPEKEEPALAAGSVRVEMPPAAEPALPGPKLVEIATPERAFEASEASPAPTSPETTEVWEYVTPPDGEPAPARNPARKAARKTAAKKAARKKASRKSPRKPDSDPPR